MKVNKLILHQVSGYSEFHQSKLNLWIHIVAVPIFIICFVTLVFGLIVLDEKVVLISLVLMVISIISQGIGHKKEGVPPEPFSGLSNFIVRIVLEQVYTFPKFVFSGSWHTSVRSSKLID